MQGNSGIADASNKTLVNDAITGGETDFLSAEVGKLGIQTYDCSKGGSVTHATLQDAINSVPTTFQKVGLTITYKSGDTIYRYTLKENVWSADPANWFSVEDKLSDLSTIFPTLFINVGSTFKSPFKNLSIEGLEYTEGIFLRQFDYKSSDSFDIVLTLGNVNGKNLTFSIAKDGMTARSGKVILDKVVVYFTLADFIQEKYHFFTDNSDDNSNYICPSVFTIDNINKENIKAVSDKLSDLSTIFPTLFINVGSTFKSPFKNLSIEGLEYTEGIFLRQFDYKSSDSFDIVLTLGNVNGKNLTFSIAKDGMTARSGKVILDKVVVYFTLADFIQEKYHFFTDNSDDNSNYICPSVFTIDNINKENIKAVSDKVNYITEIVFQYKDAKVLMFGDSFIDYGVYPTAVQNLLKCNIITRGVGGSTIVRRTDKPNQSLICRLLNEDNAVTTSGNGQSLPESCDVVIVHAGVNDFVQDKELGSIDLGMSDDSKIYSAIQVILYNLIKKYPNAKIIWDTPCHFKSRASDNKDFYYDESKNLVEVRKSCTLKEIAIAIKECCALYGVKVADMYSESGICPELEENSVLYTKDGLHPSELGAKKLAKILAKEL
ncbi:hypothetical protein F7D94_14595 [Prevotella copri]|nr:hypothetical protein [Segatella copri]MQN20448.1 hypothetical protein [Segatella copri]